MSVSEKLGMTPKTAVAVLDELFKMRERLEKEMGDLEKADPNNRFSGKYQELQVQHGSVERKMDRAMSWYSVHVLENLENETRTVKRLTKGLIALTIVLVGLTTVLAVFTWLLVTKLP